MAISHKHTSFEYPEYTPIMPWQEIVKVGIQKQQNYDQGVATVQDRINTLADLPMYRDVAKDYLKNKLNTFNSIANKYAGEDFSNPDVVKQIVSMGDPIANDEIVLNEVRSTKELARRQEVLKSLKSGERSPANDWFFNKDVEAWANSKELDASLASNKEYIKYTDLSKKHQEVYESLLKGVDSTKQDIILGNGYINTVETKGIDPKRLSEAFRASLTPSEYQQLMIDASYDANLKGKESVYDSFKNHYESVEREADATLKSNLEFIQNNQEIYNKTKDPTLERELEKAKKDIKDAELFKKVAFNKLNTYKNPEELPENEWIDIYANNFVANLSNAYAFRQAESTLKSDPVWADRFKESQANMRAYNQNLVELTKENTKRNTEKKSKEVTDAYSEAEKVSKDKDAKDAGRLGFVYRGDLHNSRLGFDAEDGVDKMNSLAIALSQGTLGSVKNNKNTLAEMKERFFEGADLRMKDLNPDDAKSLAAGLFGITENANEDFDNLRSKARWIFKTLEQKNDNDKIKVFYKNENGTESFFPITKKELLNKPNYISYLASITNITD